MSRILFISPPILNGTGGEAIRKRNRDFLSTYVGKDNLKHFVLGYYSLYNLPFINKDDQKLIIDELRKIIDDFKPNLIYLDNSLMAVPDFVFDYKTMVFFHNIEQAYAKQDKNISNNVVELIINNEANIVNKASYLVCINQRDSKQLKDYYGRFADYILPISFKDNYVLNNTNNKKGDYLLFVGTDFYGNTDGLFWFIENCLSNINFKLIVVGKGMEKYNGKFPNKNVTFLGFVSDLSILYVNASAVILPIISGSGMKTKTCEALMYGKKCFGTKEAFEGYKDINNANVSICYSAKEFIDSINSYLKYDNCIFLSKAREYFLNNYENAIVKNEYYKFLKDQVNI